MKENIPLCVYQVALLPSATVCERILSIRSHFAIQYQIKPLAAVPKILLFQFYHSQQAEERLMRYFESIALRLSAFQVVCEGYGSFPTHTVYFKIRSQGALLAFQKQFRSVQMLLPNDKNKKPHFLDEFYIPLFVKMLPWQYEKGWLTLQHHFFQSSFIAQEFVVFKKNEHEKMFQVWKHYELQGQARNIQQTHLF